MKLSVRMRKVGIMKSTLLHLAKTNLVKYCTASMFAKSQQSMSTFALPIKSEEMRIGSVLEVAGRHAIRLTQREIERFVGGDNIFPHRSDLYLIFESQHKEEDVLMALMMLFPGKKLVSL